MRGSEISNRSNISIVDNVGMSGGEYAKIKPWCRNHVAEACQARIAGVMLALVLACNVTYASSELDQFEEGYYKFLEEVGNDFGIDRQLLSAPVEDIVDEDIRESVGLFVPFVEEYAKISREKCENINESINSILIASSSYKECIRQLSSVSYYERLCEEFLKIEHLGDGRERLTWLYITYALAFARQLLYRVYIPPCR